MRCLALAQVMSKFGADIYLSSAVHSLLHEYWYRLGVKVQVKPRKIGSSDDLHITKSEIFGNKVDWVVVDGYGFDVFWLNSLGAKCRVLLLDDLGDRDAAVQLVLNHNIGAEERYLESYRRSGRALLGKRWFLLRDEWSTVKSSKQSRRLLVTLGGEDQENRVLRLMEELLRSGRGFVADVVSSAPEDGFQKATELARLKPQHFSLYRAPVNLPDRMRDASVCIVGGGVTAVEAIAAGVIPVIIVLANNQRPATERLTSLGVALSCELTETAFEDAARIALSLLGDELMIQQMRAKGQALVDGRGPSRVLNVMIEERYL